MKLALLIALVISSISADLLNEYEILSNAISTPRQRRSLEDQELVKKFLDVLANVEKYGSEKAKQAKAELMHLLEKVQDFKFADWLNAAKAKVGKRSLLDDAHEKLEEIAKKMKEGGHAVGEKAKDIAGDVTDEEAKQKMMDKILLLAKLKFEQFKTKVGAAFDKMKIEFEPIGKKYKSYGENISMLAVDGLKQFAKANVDIFNKFQEKVKSNLNGLMEDGNAFLQLVKNKTVKAFGK